MSDDSKNDQGDDGLDFGKGKPVQRSGLWSGLQSSFLAGVVVIAPVGITIALVYWFVTGPMAKLDAFVKQSLQLNDSGLETILQLIPGLGVLIAFLAIVVLGAITKNFVGRSMISFGERLFDSVPVVRSLYGFFKNVFETALRQSDRSFKEVALIEYPRHGSWVMAFVVGDAKGEVAGQLADHGDDITALFVPTVPNPTSGFLLFLPRSDLRILSMSVEEAAKVIFSLGLVVPEYTSGDEAVKKLEALAQEAPVKQRRKLFSRS